MGTETEKATKMEIFTPQKETEQTAVYVSVLVFTV